MTLQFRSRIKSVVDYSSDLKANGVCCEHNTSPNRPDGVAEYTSYLSTASQCYSDQNDGSYVTRTFYPGVQSTSGFDCLKANQPGCCCSCSYARQSENYNDFLNNIELPVDYVDEQSGEERCDATEYDLEIALNPEVGMRNNVSQCECNRIGGKWTEGICPTLDSQPPTDLQTYSYNYYYDSGSWKPRQDLGPNSKTQVIRQQCYKEETLSVIRIDEGGGPDDQLGTCCLGPTEYNDYGCYFEVVTATKCQQIACDNNYHGLGDGTCVAYQWFSCGSENIRDCPRCWNNDPINGWCCPGPNVEPQQYSQESACATTNSVDNGNYVNYEVSFNGTVYTKTGSLDVTCPSGFQFVENGACSNCTIKGLCCNRNTQVCHGWVTENECENLVPAEGDRTWNSTADCVQCSPVCCSFPLGRCCYEDRDIQSSTYGQTICQPNLYKSECETPISQGGLYQGSWSLGDCADNACGVGLCCNYEINDCAGGKTEEQCCGPYGGCNETTRVKFLPDNSGTDCGSNVCRFDKGICCSTNYDGSENSVNYCHGYITSAECDFIESTGLYAQTTWDDYYTTCNSGCPNWVNEDTGICCQDGSNPIYSGPYTPDGSYENCVFGSKVTERQCLFAQGDPDPDADQILNRKWYADAEDCATCTTQQRGRCCNYCNNTCQADVTQSQCCGADGTLCAGSTETARINATTNCSSGGAGTKTWTANNIDCNGCDFLGRCCFMRVDTDTKELKPQCTTGNTKTNCDNLHGIWNSNNTCDNNPCQWGMCCGIDEGYGKGCIVTTATTCNGSHTWSPSTNITTLVMTYQDGNPPPYTWPGTNKGAIEPTRKCLYANPPLTGFIYKVSDLFNHANLTVSECDFCNKQCNYTGTACQYNDCSGGSCSDTTSTCQCATGINYNNYIAGLSTAALANCATWYGNISTQCTCTYSGCQTCNTSSPTITLNSPGEVGEGQPITVTLTASNYNPSLPSKVLGYEVEKILGGFSFNDDINVAGSSAQNGFINTPTNLTSWSIGSTFYVQEDLSSSEGSETFRYKLSWPGLVGWNPKIVDTTINDTSLAPEFFLTFNPPLDNNSIGEKGFKDGLPTGITATTAILRVKNVPAGTTYVWAIEPFQGGSFSDFVGIGYSGGLTLGSSAHPSGGFTAGLGLTAFADQITEGSEAIQLNIKSKNGNIETSQVIYIRDESLTPEYAVVAPDQLEEGGNYLSFDITTKYVDPGTTLIWQIQGSGISPGDFEFFPGQTGETYYGTGLTGVIQIGGTYNNGSLFTRSSDGNLVDAAWLIKAKIDAIESPDEGFTFAVYSSGASLQANIPLAKKSGILIIEPTSFQLDIINYNLYPSGSKDETIGITAGLTEGYESYYFRLLTKNIPSGTTFPFRIVAAGITLYGLTGYANSGSEKLNGWNSIQGYTGMFTVGDVSGVTGVDYLRFKLNYNQFDDAGKTLSFYLLPEINLNLGASGATSGVYVVNEPSQFSLANTPSIQLTMDPPSGEIAESLSGGRLNGITFTLFTRGIGTSTSGNAMAVIGSSGPSIVNAILTPGAGICYNDFNLIRLGFNTPSGATGITFIGGFLNSGWTSGYNFSFIIGNKDTNLGHTATVFLGISGDGITDLSPCFGPTYEGFTFALSSGQSVTREFYHNNFNIPGSTYNVKIYETSYEEPICLITAYKFVGGEWINANDIVKEGDRLKFILTATKVCPNSKFKVLIEAHGSPLSNFNSDDIDFASSDTSFTVAQFEGTEEFNFVMQNGTYPNSIESAPIFMKLKNNDSFTEGIELFKISRWSKDWQYYEDGNPYTNPNYVLSLRLADTAAPDPTGTCCNPETTPFCQLTTQFNCTNPSGAKYALGNKWTFGNKCPLQSNCAGYANILYGTFATPSAESIILALQEQGYDVSSINSSLQVTTCTACCGFKSTRCCNFSTGVESSGCDATIIKGTYPCPSGSVPIGPTDDCYKRVVCCNNFNNTCRVTSESDCTGIFETPKPYVSGTCSDCDFDNDDPSCQYTVYGSKSNPATNPYRLSQYWIPPSGAVALNPLEQTAIVNIDSWNSPNPPKNSLEYGCSIDICCRGDGRGCSRVRYTWQNVSGTWVKTPSIPCTGIGDTLLSTQNKDFDLFNLNSCPAYASQGWPDDTGAYYALYPSIPWDASDFNFGVCCGLSGEEYACKGSVTTRDWCLNQSPSSNYYRWIASAKECTQVKKIVNNQVQDYTIPKYDCEVCAEVKSQQYFYPGSVKAYGTSTDINSIIPRDWNPGTLHRDIVVPACENCEYTPSTSTTGGGGLVTTFKEYFKAIPAGQGSGAYAAKFWMNYYSLPENIIASINYDQSNWEQFCCNSFKNEYPIRSNFNTNLTVTATNCLCSNLACACKYTSEGSCGNINYDQCDEGPNNQYGICCTGDSCGVVLDYQCDSPSTFTKCADLPTGSCTCSNNPCATGRCCTGTPPNATCAAPVRKIDCGGQWSEGNCTGNPCNPDPPSPEGLCCQDGACSKTTQANCNTSGGAATTFTPCTSITGACECNSQPNFCAGTQRKVCCLNGVCTFVPRSVCQFGGGTVNETAISCLQQPAPCQVATPTGACCVNDGSGCTSCTETTSIACQGSYQGDGTTCQSVNCMTKCCCNTNPIGDCACISPGSGSGASGCAAAGGKYIDCQNCTPSSGCN